MSERDDDPNLFSQEIHSSSFCFLIPKILFDSLKIFLRNKQLYFSIFALATLPLSALLFSLSLSSHHLKSRIFHLESLARLASTRFEARHVWKESRDDAVSILRLKVLFFLPCYALSLFAAVTAVNSTSLAFSGKRPNLQTAIAAVKLTWKRPLVTTIYVYVLLFAYVQIPRALAAVTTTRESRFFVIAIGSGFEVYLMAIMSLGLVVSIVEEKCGFDAIRVGSGLMSGRRISGWVLSGLFVLATGLIARELENMMDGQDPFGRPLSSVRRVAAGVGDKLGLIALYGVVVLWSYVVTAVFYCDCRRRHVVRGENDSASLAI
ncbi:hypothetical protein UlMin_004163 [Ulmus minor]